MIRQPLTLNHSTLGSLANGQAAIVIDKALTAACRDLADRGDEDGKPRVVEIKVEMKVMGGRYVVDVQAATKLPTYRTDATEVAIKGGNDQPRMLFNEANAADADQRTFDYGDDDERRSPSN